MFLLFFFITLITIVPAGASPPAGTDLASLVNKPRINSSSIKLLDKEDSAPGGYHRYIEMTVDVDMVADMPLAEVKPYAMAWDQYPRVFKRLAKNNVEDSPDGTLFTMELHVGLAGVYYITEYTLVVTTLENDDERLVFDYTPVGGTANYVSPDKTVRRPWGRWSFEAVNVDGKPCTYIRYVAVAEILKKYPLQETIMSLFVNHEHMELMRQFLKEIHR